MDGTMPELDQETTLKEMVLAISICKKQFEMALLGKTQYRLWKYSKHQA
jgi:hypothetical protein